jgi:hypothetical protein
VARGRCLILRFCVFAAMDFFMFFSLVVEGSDYSLYCSGSYKNS